MSLSLNSQLNTGLTDLEIWWPWTFEDDADFDALFCFMQTSKFECVIAGWIFSSRQGRTAPSKKELVTIERGDINQRVPFFMPLSLEWGHFLLASFLPSIPAKYNFLYCYTTANNLGIMQIAALSWILKQAYNWKWKDKRDPLLQQQQCQTDFS